MTGIRPRSCNFLTREEYDKAVEKLHRLNESLKKEHPDPCVRRSVLRTFHGAA